MWVKNPEELYHRGKKGMKWGYNDGRRNGKRTAGDELEDEDAAARKFVEEFGETIDGYKFKGIKNGYAIYVDRDDPNKIRKYKYSFEKNTAKEKVETSVTRVTAEGKKYVEKHIDETINIGTKDRNREKAMDFVGVLAKSTIVGLYFIGKGAVATGKALNKAAEEAKTTNIGKYEDIDRKQYH